jgi:hypothetical protein
MLAQIGQRPTPESWYRFARVQMLLLGASLAAVGAGFFVAANWDELTAYTRMGMLAALMTAVTLLAARLGLHSLSGRVAALLGGLGFGPLMALVGQTYQTGADAWQLFAAWTVVLLVYALVIRFSGAWITALVLAHLTAFLWAYQWLGTEPFEGLGLVITTLVSLVGWGIAVALELAPGGNEGRRVVTSFMFVVAQLIALVGRQRGDRRRGPGRRAAVRAGLAARAGRRRHPRVHPTCARTWPASAAACWSRPGCWRWRRASCCSTCGICEELGLLLMGLLLLLQGWQFGAWLMRLRLAVERRGGDDVRSVAIGCAAAAGDRGRAGPADAARRGGARGRGDRGAAATRHSQRAQRAVALGGSLSVWFGAALLASFLIEMNILAVPTLALTLGLSGLALAGVLAREAPSVLTVQMAWAGTIGGQILIMAAVGPWVGHDTMLMAAAAIGLELLTLVAIPNVGIGCAAVAAATAALLVLVTSLHGERTAFGPLSLAFGTASALLWLGEAPLAGGSLRRLWQPLAYSAAAADVRAADDADDAGARRGRAVAVDTVGFTALAAAVVRARRRRAAGSSPGRRATRCPRRARAAHRRSAPDAPGLSAGMHAAAAVAAAAQHRAAGDRADGHRRAFYSCGTTTCRPAC